MSSLPAMLIDENRALKLRVESLEIALEAMLEWFEPPTLKGLHEGEKNAIALAHLAIDSVERG